MTLARSLLALVGLSAVAAVVAFALALGGFRPIRMVENALACAFHSVMFFLIAWCWTLLRSRGIGRIACLPTIGVLLIAFAFGNYLIWFDRNYNYTEIAAFVFRIASTAAVSSTAVGLAFLARPFGPTLVVRNLAILVAVGSTLATLFFAFERSRTAEISAVVGFAFTLLSLAVLAIVHRITDPDDGRPAESVGLSLEIVCPRCRLHQTVCTGTSRCAGCRLTFRIEMEEPRCPRCRYLLHNLTQPRCPECGRALDPSDLPVPSAPV